MFNNHQLLPVITSITNTKTITMRKIFLLTIVALFV